MPAVKVNPMSRPGIRVQSGTKCLIGADASRRKGTLFSATGQPACFSHHLKGSFTALNNLASFMYIITCLSRLRPLRRCYTPTTSPSIFPTLSWKTRSQVLSLPVASWLIITRESPAK